MVWDNALPDRLVLLGEGCLMLFNMSGPIYGIIAAASLTTGSVFLTLLFIILLILIVFVILRLPIEFSAIFILPLLLVLMAYDAAFYPIGAVFLIYLAVILAKNFFFR